MEYPIPILMKPTVKEIAPDRIPMDIDVDSDVDAGDKEEEERSPPRDTPAGPYDEPEPHHEIEEQSHRRSLRPTKEVDYYPPAQLRRPRAPVIPSTALNTIAQPLPSDVMHVMEMLQDDPNW